METMAATERNDLNGLAFSATLHFLTGCAIGEFAGMMLAMPSAGAT